MKGEGGGRSECLKEEKGVRFRRRHLPPLGSGAAPREGDGDSLVSVGEVRVLGRG